MGDSLDGVMTDKGRLPVFTLDDEEVVWILTEGRSACDDVGLISM